MDPYCSGQGGGGVVIGHVAMASVTPLKSNQLFTLCVFLLLIRTSCLFLCCLYRDLKDINKNISCKV